MFFFFVFWNKSDTNSDNNNAGYNIVVYYWYDGHVDKTCNDESTEKKNKNKNKRGSNYFVIVEQFIAIKISPVYTIG